MPKRKKRRESSRLWRLWWIAPWLLAAISFLIAHAFSPATSIVRVRVVGLKAADMPAFQERLQWIRGEPYMRVSGNVVESHSMTAGEVRSAQFAKNPFRRSTLKIARRTPAASIAGDPNLVLDENGEIYRERTQPGIALPAVRLPPEAKNPAFGPLSAWKGAQIAELCVLLAQKTEIRGWIVAIERGSLVCYVQGQPGSVEFGSSIELDRKVERLSIALEEREDLLSEFSVNLVSPEDAAIRPADP